MEGCWIYDTFYSTISAPKPTPRKREEAAAKTAKSIQNTDPAMTPVGNCSKRFANIRNKAIQAKIKPNIKRPTFAVGFTSILLFTLLVICVCPTLIISFLDIRAFYLQ